jgi:hypothetical protein
MPDDIAVIKVFSNEMDAAMAQELLHNSGIESFIFKDDAGGMEPYLQLTNGVRLIVSREDAERAQEIVRTLDELL